jgi:hypothetical protein
LKHLIRKDVWRCGTCSTENDQATFQCAACECPNPKASSKSAVSTAPAPSNTNAGGGFAFPISASIPVSTGFSFPIKTSSSFGAPSVAPVAPFSFPVQPTTIQGTTTAIIDDLPRFEFSLTLTSTDLGTADDLDTLITTYDFHIDV